jgi:hypothetical protein
VGGTTVTATATDDVGVGRVELVVNGNVVDAKYAAPYVFDWKSPKTGSFVEVRAVDAAGNVGTATSTVGARTLSGTRGTVTSGAGGAFTWRAPKSGQVTFKAQDPVRVYLGRWRLSGKQVRFAVTRGTVYHLSVTALPLSWQS